jgi:uncharacterized protein YcfJ
MGEGRSAWVQSPAIILIPGSESGSPTCLKEIVMENLSRSIATASAGLFLLGGICASDSEAGTSDTHYETAPVKDVQPIIRVVQVSTPREICWDEQVRNTAYREKGGYRSHTPTVAGGILGGIVGNQLGGGRGRTVMTVAGSLLGASMGRDAGYRYRSRRHGAGKISYSTERRCEIEDVVHQEERLEGYRVTYAYHGKTYITRTQEDPGRNIEIRVQVSPVGNY